MGGDLIISHVADIDGLGAAILAKIIDPGIDIVLVEVHELVQVIKELIESGKYEDYNDIYITDLAIRNDAIELILSNEKLRSKIRHFDHHKSEVDNTKYDFINVVYERDAFKPSGTSLFYEYLRGEYPGNEILKKPYVVDFVEAIRSYDTWDWKKDGNMNGKYLTDLLSIIGQNSFINKCYEAILKVKDENFYFSEYDLNLIENRQMEIVDYIEMCDKNLIKMSLLGYNVGVSISELYRNDVGNVLSERYKDELDFILIVNFMRNSFSLRTVKNDIDLGKIVKFINPNAGGYPKAAGMPIDIHSLFILEKINEKLKTSMTEKTK